MLKLFYSNRYEALTGALLDDLSAATRNPFAPEPVIVPSAAVRRRLELDMAQRYGVCANVEFAYLAQWLWAQIRRIVPVAEHSPFTPDRLVWRICRLLDDGAIASGEQRLAAYLDAADDGMRYELARRIARLFDHYLTYRPDWLALWQDGASIFAPRRGADAAAHASQTQRADERWQAALWRALASESTGHVGGAPAVHRFLADADQLDLDIVARAEWPERVCVFALPTMPPLYMALLRTLARWVDVHMYVLNPCREFWFDIVTQARSHDLALAGRLDYQEVGHPLLAQWGRQTQAHLQMLAEITEGRAGREREQWLDSGRHDWLGAVQDAMLALQRYPAQGSRDDAARGIQVHVCHGLSRELEVLHDCLLDLFATQPGLGPADVLVATPDLAAAAPVIDAVFGTALDSRHIPYRLTGLPMSTTNAVARTLLEMLALAERSLTGRDLIEWLRVDALAARYGVDQAGVETAQSWLAAAGARRGFEPDAVAALDVPVSRHTFADALMRLYLGYAMPDGAEPVQTWLPVGGPAGADAPLLGRLAWLVDDLTAFAAACRTARSASGWAELLLDTLSRFFDGGIAHTDSVAPVRDAVGALTDAMAESAPETEFSAAVIRTALGEWLDDPERGGVPAGGVTFCTLPGLRTLPYRVVCLVGMNDGELPSVVRADEFDLAAAFPKLGDRQRREEERNLFLDALLSARDLLWISYTGRSIRDNAPLPPCAMVDGLLDYLGACAAGEHAPPEAIATARAAFVTEHPLQPFSPEYARADGRLFTYDPERAALALALAGDRTGRAGPRTAFFAQALPRDKRATVTLDDLIRFWRHPARALLRDRLGVRLGETGMELADIEPYAIDWNARDALAARVLPALITAPGDASPLPGGAVARIVAASHELPGGATGAVWREREVAGLSRLAARVRTAFDAGVRTMPFALQVQPCLPQGVTRFSSCGGLADLAGETLTGPLTVSGTLGPLTPQALVIYRYSRPGAADRLSAWLMHLVLCMMAPDGCAQRTLWLGDGHAFAYAPVADAGARLGELAGLFALGMRVPLALPPRSALACVEGGLEQARKTWDGAPQSAGESDDAYWRAALAGTRLTLDDGFQKLARAVFEPMLAHRQEV
jgi:exodeoxyribonuclease V gamma subunit